MCGIRDCGSAPRRLPGRHVLSRCVLGPCTSILSQCALSRRVVEPLSPVYNQRCGPKLAFVNSVFAAAFVAAPRDPHRSRR
jgi:hypothetical protein